MITRIAEITAIWTCHDEKGSNFKQHYVSVAIKQTYTNITPEEDDLSDWLDKRAKETVGVMCAEACESLGASVYCDESSVDYDIINEPKQSGKLDIVEIPYEIPVPGLPPIPRVLRYGGLPRAYSPTLDIFINKGTWKDVRMCARPQWQIYSIPLTVCHKNMRDHGFGYADADILVREFKNNELIDIEEVNGEYRYI